MPVLVSVSAYGSRAVDVRATARHQRQILTAAVQYAGARSARFQCSSRQAWSSTGPPCRPAHTTGFFLDPAERKRWPGPPGQAKQRARHAVLTAFSVAGMEGEAWQRPAAAAKTCCCLTARCGWVVGPRAPLLGWRAHSGVLGRRSRCQQSRPVRGQHAPVAAAASAATGTRRAARAANAQSTTVRRRPKDDGGDSAEKAELIDGDKEQGKGVGDGHAAEASLHASHQRGAATAQPAGEAGPSAEAKKPWLDGQWLQSLYAQQAELDRLQASTKLGTVAEDVRTCWVLGAVTLLFTMQGQRSGLRQVGEHDVMALAVSLRACLQVCCRCLLRRTPLRHGKGAPAAPVVSSFCQHADTQRLRNGAALTTFLRKVAGRPAPAAGGAHEAAARRHGALPGSRGPAGGASEARVPG